MGCCAGEVGVIEAEVHSQLRDFLRTESLDPWPHYLTLARLVARALRLGRSATIQTGRFLAGEPHAAIGYLMPLLLWRKPAVLVIPAALHDRLLSCEIPQLLAWLQDERAIASVARSVGADAMPGQLPRVFDGSDRDAGDWANLTKQNNQAQDNPTQDNPTQNNQFEGLWLVSPEVWLQARLSSTQHQPHQDLANPHLEDLAEQPDPLDPLNPTFQPDQPNQLNRQAQKAQTNYQPSFPIHLPTVIDGLETWDGLLRQVLSIEIQAGDWNALLEAIGTHTHQERDQQQERLRNDRAELIQTLFQRPVNPYNAYLLDVDEVNLLREICNQIPSLVRVPAVWQRFAAAFASPDYFSWAALDRSAGTMRLCLTPATIQPHFRQLWQGQPIVALTGTLDLDRQAQQFRADFGLDDATCVQFSPDRHTADIRLYIPAHLALPNTPHYRSQLIEELHTLIRIAGGQVHHLMQSGAGQSNPEQSSRKAGDRATFAIAIIIGDEPLKQSIGAVLAAEFGSRVKVERTDLQPHDILISGWSFWCAQTQLTPHHLAIATLPLPSPEHPLVAGCIASYKRRRQDWFRLYLLPQALRTLQRAIAPVRNAQGVVTLLDTRVVHRSYGKQVLQALSPYSELRYLETDDRQD